jgi:signal-transduction protein with cAMP-binding, CBS, and nucleotidyltransferase domain
MDWMLRMVKGDQNSAKELAAFLKKRAAIEQEYSRSMMKLAQSMMPGSMNVKTG